MLTPRLNIAITLAAGLAVAPAALAQISQNFDTTALGTLPPGWSTTAQGGGAPWTVVNSQANSAPNSVATNDIASVASQFLYLPAGVASGPITLDLFSYYATETTFDGWTVEASINGSPFANIGSGAWTLNGYNNTISTFYNSPIAGQEAFSGSSLAWAESTAVIPASSGDQVALRINMSSDSSVPSTGVWLDDITISNLVASPIGACCQPDGSCIAVTSATCTAGGGTYHGDNSQCGSVVCPTPPFQNGGFESGSFTPGWTQFGNTAFTAVGTTFVGVSPEEGTYCAHFGPVGSTGGVQQAVAAQTGDHVTIDFWYTVAVSNPATNSFSADFDGQNLANFQNDQTNTVWTEFTYHLIAASNNPVLSFTFQNDPSYDFLDNVVVTVTPGGSSCYANCDHSTAVPFLNVIDFTCFLQKFAAADPYANCDGSTQNPTLNVIDFTCFLQKFAAGCSAP